MIKNDYKDDVFSGNRKYRMTTNADGTVSFEDVTTYSQVGDTITASDFNSIGNAVPFDFKKVNGYPAYTSRDIDGNSVIVPMLSSDMKLVHSGSLSSVATANNSRGVSKTWLVDDDITLNDTGLYIFVVNFFDKTKCSRVFQQTAEVIANCYNTSGVRVVSSAYEEGKEITRIVDKTYPRTNNAELTSNQIIGFMSVSLTDETNGARYLKNHGISCEARVAYDYGSTHTIGGGVKVYKLSV